LGLACNPHFAPSIHTKRTAEPILR
jgi:hypothetical protein